LHCHLRTNSTILEVLMSVRRSRLFPLLRAVPLALSLLCAACFSEDPIASAPADLRPVIEAFRERARAITEEDDAGGMTVAVVDGDKVVYAEGFGWADREKKIQAGPDNIYRIGSLTKTFTAIVLMQLLDKGVVKLDDPVEKYLPEINRLPSPPAGAKPITLRMLATHTAGLVRSPADPDAMVGSIAQWEAKVIQAIPSVSFDSSPGTKYLYSNIGFGILGLALERAAQKPFIQMVEEGSLKPLGMTSTTFFIDDRLRPRLATGYYHLPDGSIDLAAPAFQHTSFGYGVPAGIMYSTVGDLARFMAALSGAVKPLTSDSLRVMMQTAQTERSASESYGFGIILKASGAVGHGGANIGYTAFFDFDPKTRLGVIVLSNGLGVVANTTMQELMRVRRGN
jgi:CubicO group peptidase (beta-lactamase class C family)